MGKVKTRMPPLPRRPQRGGSWYEDLSSILEDYHVSSSAQEPEYYRGFRLVEEIDEKD